MLTVDKYFKNENGKDYVTGDIHGSMDLLFKSLDAIGFNYEKDRLFAVGDLVNRGHQSFEMVLLAADMDWFYPTLGNHELMVILNYLYDYYSEELVKRKGDWYLNSNRNFQKGIYDILSTFPVAIELTYPSHKIGLIHAEVPKNDWASLDKPIKTFTSKILDEGLWSRDKYQRINNDYVKGVDYVFVGHTPVKKPIMLENVCYIDTGACYTEYMHIIDIEKFLKCPQFK